MKLRLLSMAGLVAVLSSACLVVGCADDDAVEGSGGTGGAAAGGKGGSGGKGSGGSKASGGSTSNGGDSNNGGSGEEGGSAPEGGSGPTGGTGSGGKGGSGGAVVGGSGGSAGTVTGGSGGTSGSGGKGGSGGATAGSGGKGGSGGAMGGAGGAMGGAGGAMGGAGGAMGGAGGSMSGAGGAMGGAGGAMGGAGGAMGGAGGAAAGSGGAAAGAGGSGGASATGLTKFTIPYTAADQTGAMTASLGATLNLTSATVTNRIYIAPLGSATVLQAMLVGTIGGKTCTAYVTYTTSLTPYTSGFANYSINVSAILNPTAPATVPVAYCSDNTQATFDGLQITGIGFQIGDGSSSSFTTTTMWLDSVTITGSTPTFAGLTFDSTTPFTIQTYSGGPLATATATWAATVN